MADLPSSKSLDTMGDHYQLNGDFSESSIQGLVVRFRRFLDGCCIRVDPTCIIIMYGSGCSFLRRRVLILLSLAARLTTVCLDTTYCLKLIIVPKIVFGLCICVGTIKMHSTCLWKWLVFSNLSTNLKFEFKYKI